MKTPQYLSAALLAALAMPVFAARDIKPQEQAPADPALEMPQVEELKNERAVGRVILRGDAQGPAELIVNGERIDLDRLKGELKFDLPERIREARLALEPIEATFLGLSTDPLTPQAAKDAGLDQSLGLVVSFVQEDSPAAKAGLQPGDVLLKLDDQLLVNAEQLVVLIRTFEPGEKITFKTLRGGERIDLEATLSSAMVAPVGPGGAAFNDPGWRVQRNNEINPNRLLLDRLRRGDQADEVAQRFQEIMEQQRIQRQNMQELFQRLDLNAEQMLGQVKDVAVKSEVVKSDGQHRITLKTDNDGRHLVIKTNAGEVLYDGMLPAENAEQHLLQDSGLPMDVIEKVRPMLNRNPMPIDDRGAQQQPAAE